MDNRTYAAALVAAALALAGLAGSLSAQEHEHEHGEEHEHAGEHPHEEGHGGHSHEGLHFTHPILTESVTPDTKIRFDHQYFDFPHGGPEHSAVFEAEYAFAPSASVEVGVPYSYSATAFGNSSVMLKLANRAFEQAGVLLGYGLQLRLPTNGAPEEEGHDDEHEHTAVRIGSQGAPAPSPLRASLGDGGIPAPRFHGGTSVEASLGTEAWEVAPFLNVGFQRGGWELAGWAFFGVPFSQAEDAEPSAELRWNLSTLYHASPRVDALVELDGSGGISGEPVGEDVVHLSPGLRFRVLSDRPLVLGTSVGFPVASGAEEDPFDVRWVTSLFWHF